MILLALKPPICICKCIEKGLEGWGLLLGSVKGRLTCGPLVFCLNFYREHVLLIC